MAISVGSVVDGYIIEAVLGSGGMGTVYRARHPSLPRSDALKVLSAELSRDDMFRARFQREADLAASLDHPNIVTIYNRGETDDGQLWIAMQYVAGSDADAEVRAGRMSARRAVTIVSAVAEALDYAHRRNILHRDVKPANFLLTDDDRRIFLADFGIARALDEAVGLTQTGSVMTSVAYAAPETLSGHGADHRSDIYALGCALFRMVVGKTPFAKPEGGMAATAAAHLTEPPPRATTVVPNLPPAIDAVFATALAKDPNQRFQSARALADAAAAALDGSATAQWPARTPPPPPQLPTSSSDPTVPSGAPGHRAGWTEQRFAEAPTQARSWSPPPSAHPPPAVAGHAQVPATSRRRRMVIGAAVAAVVVLVAAVAGFVVRQSGSDEPAYRAQTFTHAHGSTEITTRPTAVSALGPGDGAAVLALGVQPVVIEAPAAQLPSWEKSAITEQPVVLSGFTDTSAVAAAQPDLIIATGEMDDATYSKLADIAPTVTRPTDQQNESWTWQNQLSWIGQILGEQPRADELIGQVASKQEDLRNQNAAFSGKSIAAVTVADDGTAGVLAPSFATQYLETLGFRYSEDLQQAPTDSGTTRPLSDLDIRLMEPDVLVVIRTDSNAGNGGFAGLPRSFSTYQGTAVIVDDPNAIAALQDPGGYLAIDYLNETVVPQLAKLIA
ncbi:protein kinase [Mycolicibacterium sp. 3033]|nr:protein kinase [Mycolicibacterium aurantiacum]